MNPDISLIAGVAYQADKESRLELQSNILVSENDYTSSLMSKIRVFWNALGKSGTLRSQVLPPNAERKMGLDAIITVRFNDFVKVIGIEAKWPRFTSGGHKWDYLQGSSSHFDSQIERQAAFSKQVAIYEIFYHEQLPEKQPVNFESKGSSVLRFSYANRYMSKHRVAGTLWEQGDLIKIANGKIFRSSRESKNYINIHDAILECLQCKQGFPQIESGGFINLKSNKPSKRFDFDALRTSEKVTIRTDGINENITDDLVEAGIRLHLAIDAL